MEHFGATSNAVGSVVACVAIGALIAPRVPRLQATSKDLSFIVTGYSIPALMLSHMATAFTPQMISTQTAVLFATALLGCFIGVSGGWVTGTLLFGKRAPHMTKLLWFGCAFQNTVIFPLGLLGGLSVDWFTPDVMNKCTAYIFIYSVLLSLLMWTVGQEHIKMSAERLGTTKASRAAAQASATHHSRLYRWLRYGSAALWTGSFVSILLGMICGLAQVSTTAPQPLRYFAKIVFDAAETLGSLPVPLSLLLLGISLRNTATSSSTTVSQTNNAAVSSNRDVTLLAIGMIVTRLIVVPCFVLFVFHFALRPMFPDLGQDPAFMLVLIVESSAPTAIACLLVFTTYGYHPAPFAKAVFAEYLAVVVSAAVWLTIALWYVESSGAV